MESIHTSLESLLYHKHRKHLTYKVVETTDVILVKSLILGSPRLTRVVLEDICEYADNFQKTIIIKSSHAGYDGGIKTIKLICMHNYGFKRLRKVGIIRIAS